MKRTIGPGPQYTFNLKKIVVKLSLINKNIFRHTRDLILSIKKSLLIENSKINLVFKELKKNFKQPKGLFSLHQH